MQTCFVMPDISVVITGVDLLKEFWVINFLDSTLITGVVVFTPIPSDATAAVCYCHTVGPFGALLLCSSVGSITPTLKINSV